MPNANRTSHESWIYLFVLHLVFLFCIAKGLAICKFGGDFKKGEISLTEESKMSNVTTAENTDTMPQNVRTRKMTMSTLLKHQVVRVKILLSYWHTMIPVVNMMFGTLTLVQAIICAEEKKLLLNSKKEFSET
jgi:hypothetical protein